MKKISLDGLTNVLSPKEMKNVTGGSGSYSYYCVCNNGPSGWSSGNSCWDAANWFTYINVNNCGAACCGPDPGSYGACCT